VVYIWEKFLRGTQKCKKGEVIWCRKLCSYEFYNLNSLPTIATTFNLLKPSGNYMSHLLFQSITLRFVSMGLVCFSIWTRITALNSINQLSLWCWSVVLNQLSSWKNNLQIKNHFTVISTAHVLEVRLECERVWNRKRMTKCDFDFNRRSKSRTWARNMVFAPAHSESCWLSVWRVVWFETRITCTVHYGRQRQPS
jgi:hypothetical protein